MILNYQSQQQILANWCWAAVSSSVSFFYNLNMQGSYQSDIAAGLLGTICGGINTSNAGAAPPQCNTAVDISSALQLTGNYAGEMQSALAFNDIVQQINNGFPLCCQISWNNSGQAHFVGIYGYETNNLIIADPEAGIFSVPYSDFLNYRGGTWVRTIGTQHP
jgi:hypothetical protein